jgi:hypothetical protein
VERWFAELTRRKLRRSSHRSVKDLETAVTAWIEAWSADPKPFVWVKTADEILDNLANYRTRLSQLVNDSSQWGIDYRCPSIGSWPDLAWRALSR